MSDEMSIRTPTYRVPRQRGMDPTTRRLAMTAMVLGGALIAVTGAWSLTGHHGVRTLTSDDGAPVIEAPPGPMRVKPTNPGGMQLSAAEQDLFGAQGGDGGQQGKLAPAPEVPDPAALRMPLAPPPPRPSIPQLQAAPAPVAPGVPATAAAAASKPAPAGAAPVAFTGHVFVQLAALPTEQAAKEQWALLQRKLPELLQGKQLTLSSAEVNGRTWWRVRTGGFADAGDAKGFCDHARAKGASCDIAKF